MNAIESRNFALDYAKKQGLVNCVSRSLRESSAKLKNYLSSIRIPMISHVLFTFTCTMLLCGLITLIFPNSAHAGVLDFIGDAWNDVVSKLFDAINNALFSPACNSVVKDMLVEISDAAKTSDLLKDFDNMLGSYQGKFSMSSLVTSVSNAAVKPVAATLLAMGMLLQLLKIAKKMDQGGGMMPSVREVFALFVWCAIMMYMVRHGVDIVKDFYTLVLDVIKKASSTASGFGNTPAKDLTDWGTKDTLINFDNSGPVDGLLALVYCLIAWVLCMISIVISYAMMLGRAIEIYIMALFAPIPFACLGFDETRSWGWGYIRNFLALCLAGVVMVVVLYLFPFITVSILGDFGVKSLAVGKLGTTLIKLIASCLVLALTLTKSTTIARQVLGG